jgi:hypothetical protein
VEQNLGIVAAMFLDDHEGGKGKSDRDTHHEQDEPSEVHGEMFQPDDGQGQPSDNGYGVLADAHANAAG